MIETRTASAMFDSEDSSVSPVKFLSTHSSVQSSESKKRKIKGDIFDKSDMDADVNNSSFSGEVTVRSRYGRTRKPKISDDFLPTDKKVGAILGHSPKQNSTEKQFPPTVSNNSIRSKGRRLFETLHGPEPVSKVQKTRNKPLTDEDTPVKADLTASDSLNASATTCNVSEEMTDATEKSLLNCSEDQDVQIVDNVSNISVIDLESDKLTDSENCTSAEILETDNSDAQPRVLSNIENDQRISDTRESFGSSPPKGPIRSVIRKSQCLWGYKKKMLKRVQARNQVSLNLSQDSSTSKENDTVNVPIKVEPNSKGIFLKVLAFADFNPSTVVAGDLVWARVAGYPFWPALITLEKGTQNFMKYKGCGRITSLIHLHVQFFKDMGRHSWLPFTSIVEYAAIGLGDENDYQHLVKNRDPKISSAFRVKPFQQAKFMAAVSESEEMVEMSREQRLKTFSERYNSVKVLQEKRRQSLAKKRKQTEEMDEFVKKPKKIKVEEDDDDEEWPGSESKARALQDNSLDSEASKDKKMSMELRINAMSKTDKRFKKFYSKNLTKFSYEHPDVPKARLEKLLWDKWTSMSEVDQTKALTPVKPEIKKESSPKTSGSEDGSDKKTLWDRHLAGGLFRGMKKEKVCQICLTGGNTVKCRGQCCGMYHTKCVSDLLSAENGKTLPGEIEKKTEATAENSDSFNDSATESDNLNEKENDQPDSFLCHNCSKGVTPCFVCKKSDQDNDTNKLIGCAIGMCGKFYHLACLKTWPQTVYNGGKLDKSNSDKPDKIACPQHKCHTCASDDPRSNTLRFTNETLVRCVSCPTAYHTGDYCVPAGSLILNSTQIICAHHYVPNKRKNNHVNACWCFLCGIAGGTLICCDLCPSAFHPACLISSPPEGGYICEDCETGRYPIFGEIVWTKCGSYRWWPARILYPNEIPGNVLKLPHKVGQFCVRFFGSHDHFWVNRGRVFLYQDGDDQDKVAGTKSVDKDYKRALTEANEAVKQYNIEKGRRDAKSVKPPVYIRIKSNKPVGNVRQIESSPSSLTPCDCDPSSENPCGPDSDCLNRILLVECSSEVCRAGSRCGNQCFEKRLYPELKPYLTQNRGWGLKTMEDLKKGQFVIEYVGEMINEEEYRRRVEQKHQRKEENFYFLTIDKDRMLDAGPKGNVARFMNHSCQPNCETQKWTVNGDTRVGLFALQDIPANTELTFNYNLECIGTDKKLCMCGAPKCSGYIGMKTSNKPAVEDEKASLLHKQRHRKHCLGAEETTCFSCGDPGKLVICDYKTCPKGYHLECVDLPAPPKERWMCPWHRCNQCNKRTVQRCNMCTNSWCIDHAAGRIRSDGKNGYLCPYHDKGGNQKVEKSKSPVKGKAIKQESNKENDENGSDARSTSMSVDDKVEVVNPADVAGSDVRRTPVNVFKERVDKSTNKDEQHKSRENGVGSNGDLNNEQLSSPPCAETATTGGQPMFTSTPISDRSVPVKRGRGRPRKSETQKVTEIKTPVIAKVKPKLNSDTSALDSELEQLALSFGSDPSESLTNERTPLKKESNGIKENNTEAVKVESNGEVVKRKRGRPRKEVKPVNNGLPDHSFLNNTCDESATNIDDKDSESLPNARSDSIECGSGKRGRKPNKLYADYEDVPGQTTYSGVPKHAKTNKVRTRTPKNLKMVYDSSSDKILENGNVPPSTDTPDEHNDREPSPVLNGVLSDVSAAEDLDHNVNKDVHCISSSLLLPVES